MTFLSYMGPMKASSWGMRKSSLTLTEHILGNAEGTSSNFVLDGHI
jgi:hypothetical protein